MEKAKKFFARISQEGETFNAQLEKFDQDENNISYLAAIFKQLTPEMIAAKSTADLSNAIEHSKEPFFHNAETMYTKDNDDKYTYESSKFANYALCNLMAAHMVNEYKPTFSPRQRRRRNSKNNLTKESS